MTHPQPNITVNVDITNPGQFFACCGLLELADRLWPGAEGWFEDNEQIYHVSCDGTLQELLDQLTSRRPDALKFLECNGLEVRPIIAPLKFDFGDNSKLQLDIWMRIAILNHVAQVISNTPWNFWSGQQTSAGIWSSVQHELTNQLKGFTPKQFVDLFSQRILQKGRFGFDPGPSWNALDVGFSPNVHSLKVASSPATELLAAIGVQRFRPIMNINRDGFDYFVWHNPHAPAVAAAAVVGAIPERQPSHYRTYIVKRGEYAALDFAHRINKGDNNV